MSNILLSNQHLSEVQQILSKKLPLNAKVWVFGSRANMKADKGSDLDLAIDLGKKLSFSLIAELNYAFSDSNLPFKVDIIDLQTAQGIFRKNIERDKKIITLL